MKICLVTQHCRPMFIPLALLYLKACLVSRQGFSAETVAVVECPPDSTVDEILDRVVQTNADVVGMSCYVWNVRHLLSVAARLKALQPEIRIVCGGPEVGPVAADVLAAHPAVDVIVNSEGEIPFGELIACWERGDDIASVRGICRRDGEAVVQHEEAAILLDLDTIPSPHLAGYVPYDAERVISIETQRGCVFRCNFCFYNKDFSIRNRRFDLDRVKQEILYWLDRDVASIYLMDPVFNLNAQRTKDILRFIVAHNRRRASFHAEVWAEFIDEEMARLLHEANFEFLEVGLQSVDDTALATVERRLKMQRFVDGIGHLKAFEVPFELQLIYGLPGETRASFRKSLDFAASLDAGRIEVFPLMVLPGTELWRKAETLRLTFDPDPPYLLRSHMTMTREDVEYGQAITKAVDEIAHRPSVKLLGRELKLRLSDLVDAWIEWRTAQKPTSDVVDGVGLFLEHMCARHGIPSDFYRVFAAREMKERPKGNVASTAAA